MSVERRVVRTRVVVAAEEIAGTLTVGRARALASAALNVVGAALRVEIKNVRETEGGTFVYE